MVEADIPAENDEMTGGKPYNERGTGKKRIGRIQRRGYPLCR